MYRLWKQQGNNILDVSPLFVASNSGDWWGHRDNLQVLKEKWRAAPMFYSPAGRLPHTAVKAVLHRGKVWDRWRGNQEHPSSLLYIFLFLLPPCFLSPV